MVGGVVGGWTKRPEHGTWTGVIREDKNYTVWKLKENWLKKNPRIQFFLVDTQAVVVGKDIGT